MLYYVRTGEIDASVRAENPRQAAVDILRMSSEGCGDLTIVSEEEIRGWSEDHLFFLTASIMEECVGMRITG
jgi:hypothetical protein